jgi:hypothetical protein
MGHYEGVSSTAGGKIEVTGAAAQDGEVYG